MREDGGAWFSFFFFWQRCREVEVIGLRLGGEKGLGLKFLIFSTCQRRGGGGCGLRLG